MRLARPEPISVTATTGKNLRLCAHYQRLIQKRELPPEPASGEFIMQLTDGGMWILVCQDCREEAGRRGISWEELLNSVV